VRLEKIEERNEELHKLRKKTTTTVQVLTHIKEKLQFVKGENGQLKHELSGLDVELTEERDGLTKSKRERDRLRKDNSKLKQRQGFVDSDLLVQDFEQRKIDMEALSSRLQELKDRQTASTSHHR
jgi:chromosome segregation ATPase